jgi:peptidoglycan/LPS O-acetylase OafA/YrhL
VENKNLNIITENATSYHLPWIDTLKFFAAFWILFSHFISGYFQEYLKYFRQEGIVLFFLDGITGKLCVALFCIFLGFFAFEKHKKTPFVEYAVTRYLQFVKYIFITNALRVIYVVIAYYILQTYLDKIQIFFVDGQINWVLLFQTFFSNTFFFKSELIATYWCLPAFFIGSFIVYALGTICSRKRYTTTKQVTIVLGVYLICICAGQVWIANCILGGLLRIIYKANPQILKKWYILILLFGLMLCLYRWLGESYVTYIAYGWACLIFVLICNNIDFIKRILSVKFLSVFCGKISFELFLVHPLVLTIFTVRFVKWGGVISHFTQFQRFIICFSATFALSILLAYCLKLLIKTLEVAWRKKHANTEIENERV